MNTAVSIPDDLYERAEERARALGMSRDEFYTAALADFVSEAPDEQITASLDRLYENQQSELDPVVARMQAASLRREDW